MNISNANNPALLRATAEAADFIAALPADVRAQWDALAAEERAERDAYRANTARVQQHLVIQAKIGRDTIRLADETIAPAQITRAGCRALAKEHGASVITIKDSTWTRSEHNYYGDLPEKCLQDRVYRYVAKTDSLEVFEHGKLVYLNNAGFRMSGEDLDRLAAECEFGA